MGIQSQLPAALSTSCSLSNATQARRCLLAGKGGGNRVAASVPGDPPKVELLAHNQHHRRNTILAPSQPERLTGRLPMNASHSFNEFGTRSARNSTLSADPALASFPPPHSTSNSPLSHDPASPHSATMGQSQEEFPDLNGMGLYAATITGDGKPLCFCL